MSERAKLTMEAPNDREPWSYERLRRKLTVLIEVMPSATGNDEISRRLLKDIREDLIEVRDGLTAWYGAGIFTEKKENNL